MQETSLATRLGALALAATLAVGGVSGPALPLPAHAEEEEGAPGAISRFASASERRAAMAERRAALLRAAREEAERAGAVAAPRESPKEEPAEAERDRAASMQSMLRSLNPAVRARAAGDAAALSSRRCVCTSRAWLTR